MTPLKTGGPKPSQENGGQNPPKIEGLEIEAFGGALFPMPPQGCIVSGDP
jgi:hypothetical protein